MEQEILSKFNTKAKKFKKIFCFDIKQMQKKPKMLNRLPFFFCLLLPQFSLSLFEFIENDREKVGHKLFKSKFFRIDLSIF